MAHLIVVSGPTESGKTYWVKRQIATAQRLIVIDPIGEYDVGGVTIGMEESLDRVLQLMDADVPRFRLSCRLPMKATEKNGPVAADELVRAVWGFQSDYANPDERKKITLVIDEADRISKPGDRDTGVDIMIQYGRRVADPCYLLTRRLARLARDATSNVKRPGGMVLFGFDEPNDLEELRKRKGPEAVERVLALKQFECLTL